MTNYVYDLVITYGPNSDTAILQITTDYPTTLLTVIYDRLTVLREHCAYLGLETDNENAVLAIPWDQISRIDFKQVFEFEEA